MLPPTLSLSYILVASVTKSNEDFNGGVKTLQTASFSLYTFHFLNLNTPIVQIWHCTIVLTSSKVRLERSAEVMLGVRSVMYPINPIRWPSISTTCFHSGIKFRFCQNHLGRVELDSINDRLILNQVGGQQIVIHLPEISQQSEQALDPLGEIRQVNGAQVKVMVAKCHGRPVEQIGEGDYWFVAQLIEPHGA